MARLSNIKLHQEKKQAIAPEERTITPLNARFTPTTAEEALDVRSTEAVDPKSQFLGFERTGIVSAPGSKTRETDLTNMNEETFLANQDKLNASGKEYWAAQVKKDPTNVYAAVNEFLASSETPEEKRKRERREAVGEAINGLGNLIGNVANLYYAPRSGYSIDLNTMDDKRRERMERIQAKRDALDNQRQQMILNAKIGQMNAERAAKIAADKAKADAAKDARDKAWKIKYDAYMKELDNAHKLGQIDAQTKAKLAEQAAKTKSDKELESFKQSNRIALKTTPSYGEDKVLDSVKGDDGNIWTRNTKLTPSEIKQIAMSSRNYQDKSYQDRFRKTTVDADGQRKMGDIDYNAMAAEVIANGEVPSSVLKQMGFKAGDGSTIKWTPSSEEIEEWK
ncbi:MAG: hypothetical protein U0M06_06350 [Clostridia bacterium]|nr:hypothetical protein [Clostridia bacterium]